MPIFDFHCHPGLKPQFNDPAHAVSPWENIVAKAKLWIIKNIRINQLFNEVLDSQSSLTQLCDDVKLFGLVLHAPESHMAAGLLMRSIVSGGGVNGINVDRIKYIAEGTHNYTLIQEELERLKNSFSTEGATLEILKNAGNFNEQKANTIYGFICIEGLHCFFNQPDNFVSFEENFDGFVSANKVFAMNICHLQQNPFCNHAHGIQFFADDLFYPTGNGISDMGEEVIKKMVAKNILIDTKHTSLYSRMQLYSMMQNNDGTYKQPLICTHTGVTGIRANERIKYLIEKPGDLDKVYKITYAKPASSLVKDTYYNCSSINLYDEDIVEILKSGGLIGISLDQRILGFANENVLKGLVTPSDVEYISKEEENFFFSGAKDFTLYQGDAGIWSAEDFENSEHVMDEKIQFKFFFNNVLHILHVARLSNIPVTKAARQICIGSDYDGLINAIDNCKTATGFKNFKQSAIKALPRLLKDAGLDNEGLNPSAFAEDLFYRNGRDFVLARLG